MVTLSKGQPYKATYTGTGVQEEILFKKGSGYPLHGSVRVTGGPDDVFVLEEKLVDWEDGISSSGGKIPAVEISGKSAGVRVDISVNISGSIKAELIL
jgi:hypothetical protein